MNSYRRAILLVTVISVLFLSVSVLPLNAQGDNPTLPLPTAPLPISIGANQTGEVNAAVPTPSFVYTASGPQSISVLVLAITPGYFPSLRVIGPNGAVVQTINNLTNANTVETDVLLTSAGPYIIEVAGANGSVGQFIMNVQGGAPLPPSTPLAVDQTFSGRVDDNSPLQSFSFNASPTDILRLSVYSADVNNQPATTGPTVTLMDAATDEVLATSSTRIIGANFRIPRGSVSFEVLIARSAPALAEAYSICLEVEGGPLTCIEPTSAGVAIVPTVFVPPTLPPPTVPPVYIDPNGPCAVTPGSAPAVNIRNGPGLSYGVVGQLITPSVASVLARLPDGTWYQININGVTGWVAASVVRLGGNCGAVTIVTVVAPPPGAPTWTPTVTYTPTASPTASPTYTPTATATATETQPVPVATLNYSLPPVYGSTALTSGFVPDPFTVGVTAGGPASANYLGGGCTGYTTSAPSFSVNYTSGAFPTLRFYFIGSGDTTMIINSPSGSYFCVDDSFGTLNPTIDFNTPSSGRYDVWVASYAQGASIGGTLYVTENTGNHP